MSQNIIGSHGVQPEQIKRPVGIAVHDMDNIYVSSEDKLQKLSKHEHSSNVC